MRYLILLIFCLSGLSGCKIEEEADLSEESPEITEEAKASLNNEEVPAALLVITDSVVVDSLIEGNLYGRFFNERAEFYIIENPTNKIHHASVKLITLCFLDGQLNKAKYILSQDVSKSLIQTLGGFKISAYDPKNKEIIKSRKVLVATDDGPGLNPLLDNFELKWIFEDNLIVYQVNLNNRQEPFKYVEKLKSFDQHFRLLERFH